MEKNNLKELIVDATERRFHRPKDKDDQKALYSGKRKAHTIKNTLIVGKKKYIHFLGHTTQGSVHDLRLLEFDLDNVLQVIFQNITLFLDLGYTGIEKYFKIMDLIIPIKKPRKSENNPTPELTKEQKDFNKNMSSERVAVEHVIGTIKRFKILTDVFRNNGENDENLFIEIIAGVHNLEYK